MRSSSFGRKGAGRAIAAGGDDLQLALDLLALGQVVEIGLRGSPARTRSCRRRLRSKSPPSTMSLQRRHLVRTEGQRPLRAHLDAGPAVLVVRGGDHRDRRRVERELREIGHRRQRQPDILDARAGGHQARHQRQLDGHGIGAEIVPGDDVGPGAEPPDQRAEPHAERLHADQVEVGLAFRARMPEPPARVIFAKARWA